MESETQGKGNRFAIFNEVVMKGLALNLTLPHGPEEGSAGCRCLVRGNRRGNIRMNSL